MVNLKNKLSITSNISYIFHSIYSYNPLTINHYIYSVITGFFVISNSFLLSKALITGITIYK